RVTIIHLTASAVGVTVAGGLAMLLLQVAYVPPPLVSGWRSLRPRAEQNQLGFRGRPIVYAPEDYVILLLGDSQVEGYGLPFDAMPERVLESHLDWQNQRTRVFSVGAGGYGQDQELLALEEYFGKYRANLVVVW